MKIKHENTFNLTADEIAKILVKMLGMPQETKVSFEIKEVDDGYDRYPMYKFDSASLTYFTEKEI